MKVVLLFPGQGAQQPGMGKDLAEAFPEARAAFGAGFTWGSMVVRF